MHHDLLMITDLELIIEEIDSLSGEILYDYLLQMGEASMPLTPDERTRERQIIGCQSQVWLKSRPHDTKFFFDIDSDSMLVKGVANIVALTFNGCTKEEANEIKFEDFKPIAAKLSYQRQRGLQSIINKVHGVVNAV